MSTTTKASVWVNTIGTRCLHHFDAMLVGKNLDYGDELEVALAQVLKTVVPARIEACRGYCFDIKRHAGDDIILYDANAAPTLRGLSGNLSIREFVPFEAVMGYVEAKHTLNLNASDDRQSLQHACRQVHSVASLEREALPISSVEGVEVPIAGQIIDAGWPKKRNPLFSMVFARKLSYDVESATTPTDVLSQLAQLVADGIAVPDVIVADRLLVMPVEKQRQAAEPMLPVVFPRPFFCTETELVSIVMNDAASAFGVALSLLSWALSWSRPGPLHWTELIRQGLPERFRAGWLTVPITGSDNR
jgi:hypothetical protein